MRVKSIDTDREVQEEFDMVQLNESTTFAGIENIKKAIRAKREEDWSALEAHRRLSFWVVDTLKRCVTGSLSNDAGKFEVLDFLGRIIVSHTEVG